MIFWIPYIHQSVEDKHPNLDMAIHKHPKFAIHVQGSPYKKVSFQGHNPCSKFSKGNKFSQISCPTRQLFGTCNYKSLEHGPLYWDPPPVTINAIIFYYYILSRCVICIVNKQVCQRGTIMQRQCTFSITIVCCLLIMRNWWFYISSHFLLKQNMS